ncbi:winged helix-turn-helix domain-containing protein [Streptomyces sp. NPDC002920]
MAIADHIAWQISSCRIPVGGRLPGEIALAAGCSVARMTIARAIRELRQRGLVRTAIGKGSYVIAVPGSDSPENGE